MRRVEHEQEVQAQQLQILEERDEISPDCEDDDEYDLGQTAAGDPRKQSQPKPRWDIFVESEEEDDNTAFAEGQPNQTTGMNKRRGKKRNHDASDHDVERDHHKWQKRGIDKRQAMTMNAGSDRLMGVNQSAKKVHTASPSTSPNRLGLQQEFNRPPIPQVKFPSSHKPFREAVTLPAPKHPLSTRSFSSTTGDSKRMNQIKLADGSQRPKSAWNNFIHDDDSNGESDDGFVDSHEHSYKEAEGSGEDATGTAPKRIFNLAFTKNRSR